MTQEHIFFIPTIFFLGFFLGAIVSQRNKSPNFTTESKLNHGEKENFSTSIFTSFYTLGFSFFIFFAIFISTHLLPFFGGSKALSIVSKGKPLFDQRPVFTNLEFYERLNSFGEVGREMYLRFTYTVDILFPLAFLSFLILLILFISKKSLITKRVSLRLLLFPLIWFFLDMLENSILFFLIYQFPIEHDFLSAKLGFVTLGKFCFLLLSLLLPGIAIIYDKKIKLK